MKTEIFRLLHRLKLQAVIVYRELMLRQPLLTVFAGLMLALALPTALLLAIDDRTWRDVAIWTKPLKFMISTAAFVATTAWFIGLLPKAIQVSSIVRRLAWTVVITSTFEVGYISLQAALGEGSHHNVSDPLHAALFGVMAIAAVFLTATQALLAWLVARHSLIRETLFARSVGNNRRQAQGCLLWAGTLVKPTLGQRTFWVCTPINCSLWRGGFFSDIKWRKRGFGCLHSQRRMSFAGHYSRCPL